MIEFLNSGILALAAATVIPILIYLFVIKRPKRVIFSSIRHIKASQKKQKSRIKLKNILLLIIRCLIIIFAVLALARPALKLKMLHKWSKHSQTAIAIILDTSYSMDYLADTRTELEIGKEIVKKVNNKLTDRDMVMILTSDSRWNRLYATQHYGEVPDYVLATIAITAQPIAMEELIKEATTRLKETHILNKGIIVITDFRKQNYPQDNEIPVLLIPTSDNDDRNNISVQNAKLEEEFVERKPERKVNFEVVNHSNIVQNDVVCQLYVNGRTISEKVADLQPNQRRPESFNISIDEPGWYSGYVQVKHERLSFDTRSYFSFYNPEIVKVAVISDGKSIPLSLMSILEIYVKKNGKVDFIVDDNLNYERFATYQFVIIDNERTLTPRLSFIIERLIEEKKGVLHFAGRSLDDSWKDYFEERVRLELAVYDDNHSRRISYINEHHPIMSVIEKESSEDIELTSYWRGRIKGPANVLFQADNIPLAIEQNREVIWLFDINDVRNKILLDPIFPVMAYRTFLYCSYSESPSYIVGDRINIPLNNITLPNGDKIETTDSSYLLATNGIYQVPVAEDKTSKIAVNIDYSPSEYTRMERIDTDKLMTLDKDWEEKILRSRYGVEIWKYLFVVAILLVAAEMLIVKRQERKGSNK